MVSDSYVFGLVFLRLGIESLTFGGKFPYFYGVSNSYGWWLVFLLFPVSNSYVEAMVFFTFGG